MKLTAKTIKIYCLLFLTAILWVILNFDVKELLSFTAEKLPITPTSCTVFNVPQKVKNATCGYITVPEFHEFPQNTIELAFIHLKSSQNGAENIPLVMERGGPGASTFQLIEHFQSGGLYEPLQAQQDIILIEQRGTFYTKPHLYCTTAEAMNPKWCKERWEEIGVNFNAYNMLEKTHDIVFVMEQLGYEQFNYYGSSYSAQLGLYLMRDYPQNLHKVILDSVVPVDVSLDAYQYHSLSEALRYFFDQFRLEYPTLEQDFLQLRDRIISFPPKLSFINTHNTTQNITLTWQKLVYMLRDFLYDAPLYLTDLPPTLQAMTQGDYQPLQTLYQRYLQQDLVIADGVRFATLCASPKPPMKTLPLPDPFPEFEAWINPNFLQQFCQAFFPVALLPDYVYEPVQSEIPTLILQGKYDPVTPLYFGEYVAQFLPYATIQIFPHLGHSVLTQGEHPVKTVNEFLN